MNFLMRTYFEQRGGMFREFEGLMAFFKPKDISLYRKLLPRPFDVPDQPVVIVFLADYLRIVTWLITRYRYQEWSVLLKCLWNGKEGWYSVTMPVSGLFPQLAGRYLGFPKYIADQITLTRDGQTRLATSRYKGSEQLRLEYCPGITRSLAPWEKELLETKSFFKGDTFLLVPPGRGPRAQKVVWRHVIPPKWSPEPGMVRVRADPNESWANLVPATGEFPGAYNHFIGGANLIPEEPV